MTKEEFAAWKHSTVTIEVFGILKQARDAYAEAIVGGATLESMTDTARAVGTIQAFDYLLNLQYEEASND